jgi:hydrogenase-4 component F
MDLTFLAQLTLAVPIILAIIGVIFLTLRLPDFTGRWLGIATVLGSAGLFLISIAMMSTPTSSYPLPFPWVFGIMIHLDALSVFFILLINVIMFAASWNALSYLEGRDVRNIWQGPTAFHILVNLFHFTMLLVPMLDNLVGVWIAIELTTLGSAFLVAFQNKRSSWEAAWKYLIITSTGIVLALLGTIFLANAITVSDPTSHLPIFPNSVMDWTYLMQVAKDDILQKDWPVFLQKDFVWLAFLFALVGYGTKAGLAPMHTWLPDGHGEAPSPISALLSGVLLKSALYAILRFYTLTNTVLGNTTSTSAALLIVSLFSLLVATPLILKKNRFKRVLAYHSLEHMGIITFGLALGGPIAIFGALLHSLNHAITKALMFLTFGNVIKQYGARGIQEQDITGILRSMPFTGAILILGGLALVGAPPFNIFMSEFIILWGALSKFQNPGAVGLPGFNNWAVIAAIFIFMFSTTVIFYGLVKHLGKLVLNKMPYHPESLTGKDEHLEKRGWSETAPLVILFSFMLLLGLWIFPPLANLINESVKIILGQV